MSKIIGIGLDAFSRLATVWNEGLSKAPPYIVARQLSEQLPQITFPYHVQFDCTHDCESHEPIIQADKFVSGERLFLYFQGYHRMRVICLPGLQAGEGGRN